MGGSKEKNLKTPKSIKCPVISVRSWNFKDGGSLKASFLAKNQYATKKKSLKKSHNCTFKVNFGCQKLIKFFQKKILSKNINLGDHYLSKTFFLNSIFEPLYFLKLCPIFDRLSLFIGIFKRFFLDVMLIFGQKPYF